MAIDNVMEKKPSAELVSAVAAVATTKGYNLYECVPLTEGSQPWWQINRGFSMKFFATFAELSEHVNTAEPWKALGKYSVAL